MCLGNSTPPKSAVVDPGGVTVASSCPPRTARPRRYFLSLLLVLSEDGCWSLLRLVLRRSVGCVWDCLDASGQDDGGGEGFGSLCHGVERLGC